MRKDVKIVGFAVGGVLGMGVLGVVGLAALGLYLKSAGYAPRRARAQQPAAAQSAGAPRPVASSGGSVATPPGAERAPATASAAPRATTGGPVAARGDLVTRLEALKAKAAYADLAEVLFKGAGNFSEEDRAAAIAWLEPQERWGRLPVLFLLSRLHEAGGDLTGAAKYYAAGSLAYRIDARCVRDTTARQAVTAMESLMTGARSHLSKNPTEVAGAVAWALEKEEAIKDREPAHWIAAHGMAAVRGETTGFAEGEEREKIRADMRKAFEGTGRGQK